MRVYLNFGQGVEPRQTVQVPYRLSVTDTISQVFYEGRWRRLLGTGSTRVGWYIVVNKERIPIRVASAH